jgi:O-antigen ligase
MNPLDLITALILLVGLLVNTMPAIPIAAMGVVVLRGTSTRLQHWLGFRRIEWGIVICLAYWLASFFWSGQTVPELVSYDFLRNDGAMLFSYTALIFFLGWPLKARYCRAFWLLFLAVLSGVALAGTAISLNLPYSGFLDYLGIVGVEQVGGGDVQAMGGIFYGWYHAHNTAGGAYAVAVVLGLALVQEAKLGWKQRIFRRALVICCLIGLVLTYSRGAWLGFVAGAAVVLPIRKLSQTFKVALLLGVPTLLVALMSNSVIARMDTFADPYSGTAGARLDLWADALDDFANSPVVGMGYGRYNDIFEQFTGVRGIIWVATKGIVISDDSHAHNSYLHFLAEGGILGLLVTMFVWWCAWKELSFFESHFPRSQLYWLEKAAKACLVVALVQALTEHVMGRGSIVLILDALIGMTIAAARFEARAARAAAEAEAKRAAANARSAVRRPVPAVR